MAGSGQPPNGGRGWRRPLSAAERSTLEAQLPGGGGLCASCRHLRLARSARAVYARCLLAETEPGYERYPVLPVRACAGHRSWSAQD